MRTRQTETSTPKTSMAAWTWAAWAAWEVWEVWAAWAAWAVWEVWEVNYYEIASTVPIYSLCA